MSDTNTINVFKKKMYMQIDKMPYEIHIEKWLRYFRIIIKQKVKSDAKMHVTRLNKVRHMLLLRDVACFINEVTEEWIYECCVCFFFLIPFVKTTHTPSHVQTHTWPISETKQNLFFFLFCQTMKMERRVEHLCSLTSLFSHWIWYMLMLLER